MLRIVVLKQLPRLMRFQETPDETPCAPGDSDSVKAWSVVPLRRKRFPLPAEGLEEEVAASL